MNQQKPEYLRPALIVGAIAGVLSGLPVFSLVNCVCCLWILGGAALAVKTLSQATTLVLKPSDGALEGALTGIIAAIAHTLTTLAFKPDMETARRVLDWLSSIGIERPSNIDGILERTTAFMSPAWIILGLFITAIMYALVGALGGVIGVSLFGKKPAPAVAAPPPPPPSSGPADAT
jgi:hypothetical protein